MDMAYDARQNSFKFLTLVLEFHSWVQNLQDFRTTPDINYAHIYCLKKQKTKQY